MSVRIILPFCSLWLCVFPGGIEGFRNFSPQCIIMVFRVSTRNIRYRSAVAKSIIGITYGKRFSCFWIVSRLSKQVAKRIISVGGTNSQTVFALGKPSCKIVLVKDFQFRYSFISRKDLSVLPLNQLYL